MTHPTRQNAQHSAKSSLWMTPEPILESVREFFGGTIDLDAASDEEANRRVKAGQYLTDALGANPWPTVTSCFLNPPGGKGLPKQFWHKLLREVREGRVGHAIYLAFSLEQLQTIEGMLQYPLCVPNQRLKFVSRWDPSVKTEEEFRAALSALSGPDPSAMYYKKHELLSLAKAIEDGQGHLGSIELADLIRERYAASPTHANAIVYVPGQWNLTDKFLDVFTEHGDCR